MNLDDAIVAALDVLRLQRDDGASLSDIVDYVLANAETKERSSAVTSEPSTEKLDRKSVRAALRRLASSGVLRESSHYQLSTTTTMRIKKQLKIVRSRTTVQTNIVPKPSVKSQVVEAKDDGDKIDHRHEDELSSKLVPSPQQQCSNSSEVEDVNVTYLVEVCNAEDPILAILAAQVSGCASRDFPNIRLRSLMRVENSALRKKFDKFRQALPENVRDSMLFFHGTEAKNVNSICRRGWSLALAGSRNGSALGKGIYVSSELSTALKYSPSTRASLCPELEDSTTLCAVPHSDGAGSASNSTSASLGSTTNRATLPTPPTASSSLSPTLLLPETLRRTVLLGRACVGKVHRAPTLSKVSTLASFSSARKASLSEGLKQKQRLPSGYHSLQARDSTRVFFDEGQIIPEYVMEIEYDVPWDRL